ncbi:TPA: UDP-N-acetylmuramoyl-tripeptide--D-alanyl-D-alanine ligase [Candidatus Latescibacteria bacterium]|nr:UDP-N-acetylmuramoyl-tripeptide--D-alanyl-D-alanine ligase [Candidatus Latescibacterota bacterium]
MIDVTLQQAAEWMSGELIGDADAEPPGVSLDNRAIEAGELFFAIRGEQTDGHRYIDAAFKAGASAAIVQKDWIADNTANGPLIGVHAPDLALGDLARAYRKRFDIPVVGITGSNGKTTTKDMTAAVLGTRYNVLKTPENQNTRLGVPMTILELDPSHEVAVIEMGISEHHGLTYLCEVADPTIGVITNIGPTHLEFLGSVEGVAAAKGELLEYLDESSMAILNFDDLLLPKERAKGRLLGFGIEEDCQFRGEGFVLDREGCGHFSLQSQFFDLRIPGRHNAYNALAAAAVGAALDVPLSHAAQALQDFELTRWRSQIAEKDGVRVFNDAYNANPASMKAALLAAKDIDVPGRRIAILGDMLELGPGSEEAHFELGRHVQLFGINELVAVGEFADNMAAGAVEAGLPHTHVHAYPDREPVISFLRETMKEGDLVLVKGSRGIALEKVVEALGF